MDKRDQNLAIVTLRGDTPRLRLAFQLRPGPGERYQELRGAALMMEINDAGRAREIRDRIVRAIEAEFSSTKKEERKKKKT